MFFVSQTVDCCSSSCQRYLFCNNELRPVYVHIQWCCNSTVREGILPACHQPDRGYNVRDALYHKHNQWGGLKWHSHRQHEAGLVACCFTLTAITFAAANVDLIRLEFDAVFGSVFGGMINQTAVAGFEAAVRSSLASNHIDTTGLLGLALLPGSIIVDIIGTPTTISAIQGLAESGKYFVAYDGQAFSLVMKASDSTSSGEFIE